VTEKTARRAKTLRQTRSVSIRDLLPPPGLAALRFAIGGDEYVILEFPEQKLDAPSGLSNAEREVVRGVIAGKSNAQIGRERGTSARTVANQLRSVYAKLNISGRRALIRACRRTSALVTV
jgi:DNA-binding CsgD family transcriptional regulator